MYGLSVFIILTSTALSLSALVSGNQPELMPWKELEYIRPGEKSYGDIYSEFTQKIQQMNHWRNNGDIIFEELYEMWNYLLMEVEGEFVNGDSNSGGEGGSLRAQLFQVKRNSGVTNPGAVSPLVSALLDTLEASESNTSSQCMNDTGRTILGLYMKENWAFSLLDSSGKPGISLMRFHFNFVGNYDQCRGTHAPPNASMYSQGFSGTYAEFRVFIGTPDPLNPLAAPLIQLGLCMPDTCSENQLSGLLLEVLSRLPIKITLSPLPAQIRSSVREVTTATIWAIVFLCIIGSLMILGTAYDVIFLQWPKWSLARLAQKDGLTSDPDSDHVAHSYQPIGGEDRAVEGTNSEGTPLLKKPLVTHRQSSAVEMCGKILVSFSVYTNGSKVLNTSQPPGSLSAINGIRFLSMTWVIMGHVYIFGLATLENPAFLLSMLDRWTFDPVANAFFSVDTFFALSGLLTAYITIKEMRRKSWKINWGLYYFHRFWRLTPPYMLALLLILGLQRFLGSGALWDSVQPMDKVNCEKNWWTNLLYINNIVKPKEMCLGHSWYMANDMQFFVLSPLMLIPFYFNVYAGLGCCMLFLMTTWITTGALSTYNEWHATFISKAFVTDPSVELFIDYYIAPWCRIGPYIIGILTGYLLAVNNGKMHMKWHTNLIGWAVATAVGLAIIYGLDNEISGEHLNTVGVAAFYNTISRSAWAVCVCWVIVSCVSGYGGFVNTILSWSPFVILARMTYMAYLIHPCIIYTYYGNMGQLYHNNTLNFVVTFLGILVLTYMAAFVLMLGLESPMIGLEKVFLRNRRRD